MPTANYRFLRGSDTNEGKLSAFFSQNRVSTDALNALEGWSSAAPYRHHKIVEDSDDELIATLTWGDSDHQAGPSLEMHCARVGVLREFVRKN